MGRFIVLSWGKDFSLFGMLLSHVGVDFSQQRSAKSQTPELLNRSFGMKPRHLLCFIGITWAMFTASWYLGSIKNTSQSPWTPNLKTVWTATNKRKAPGFWSRGGQPQMSFTNYHKTCRARHEPWKCSSASTSRPQNSISSEIALKLNYDDGHDHASKWPWASYQLCSY